jgi:hypothetical protein
VVLSSRIVTEVEIVAKLKRQAQSNLNAYYSGARPVEVRAEHLKVVCELAESSLLKEEAK